MKKLLTLILTLLILMSLITTSYSYPIDQGIPVPEFRGATMDIEDKTEYLGYSKGAELLENSIFIDTTNHWAKRAITRMSAQSVVKGYGENRFNPDGYIKRQEVLALLVRMMGREGVVQQNLSNQGEGLAREIVNDLWAEGYIIEAENLGILTGNESANFRSYATREEVAIWVGRLLGLAPVFDNIEILYTFDDWRQVSLSNIGLVEAVLQERIMQGDSDGNFNPKSNITRAEVTSILNNISDRLYEERNITANFGQVINIQKKNTKEIGMNIVENIITVKNVDGSITSLITRTRSGEVLNEFVVYKKGIVSGSNMLSVGDEIEYILKNDQVVYAEAYNDGSILEKIKENSLQDSNLRTYFGKIISKTTENFWTGEKNISIDRFRVRNIDGQVFDIVVETDLNTGIKNDIIVYKGDRVGGSSLLEKNDDIEYVVKNNQTIVYASITSLDRKVISGTVQTVNIPENKISIVDYNDNVKVFGMVPYIDVTINLRPAELTDLQYGQDVTLNISNGLVTSISGETFLDEPGYIPANGKVRTGQIKYITDDSITIEYGDGTSDNFRVHEDTIILKEDTGIRFRDLREGDRVKLYFDNIYSSEVSKIQVEGKQQLIKKIYRGKIDKVDISDNEITLTYPRELENSQWEDINDYSITIEIADGADIYSGGELITIDELEDEHENDYVYVALEDSYGKDKAIKLAVKEDSEKLYDDRIKDINYAANKLELDNGRNIAYDEGTIIIKDNRLVGMSSLEEDLNALVVADYDDGDYRANVIRLGRMGYRIFENIYVGKIDAIDSDKFDVIWYSELDGNEWDRVSSSTRRTLDFEYDDDTYIVDVTNGYDEISPYDFFHDGYSREENEDYYTFIVADGDRDVFAMTLREDELFKDSGINDDNEIEDELERLILTKGTVEDVDQLRERMQIEDPYDWSSFYEEWQENRNDEYVDIGEALFIKGDKVMDMDDVEEGDTVYILRNDEDAIIVFVE